MGKDLVIINNEVCILCTYTSLILFDNISTTKQGGDKLQYTVLWVKWNIIEINVLRIDILYDKEFDCLMC